MSDERFKIEPKLLFVTIVGILLFHYVFLGVQLGICTWAVRLNFLKLIEQGPVTAERIGKAPVGEQKLCHDIDDDFRNARNKSLEIMLALLVPTVPAGAAIYDGMKSRKKKPPVTGGPSPSDDDPTA